MVSQIHGRSPSLMLKPSPIWSSMRQQLNSHDLLMAVSACLRSRCSSNKRMVKTLIRSGQYGKLNPTQFSELQQTEFDAKLPAENWLDRMSTAVAAFMGHIITVSAFWVCISIWIGFEKYCGWSNAWQLYIKLGHFGIDGVYPSPSGEYSRTTQQLYHEMPRGYLRR